MEKEESKSKSGVLSKSKIHGIRTLNLLSNFRDQEDEEESPAREIELERMATLLWRLGGRGSRIREDSAAWEYSEFDFDPDKNKS